MKKSKAMLFIAPALFSYAMAAQACTTLAIQDKARRYFSWAYAGIYAGFTLMVNVLPGGNTV